MDTRPTTEQLFAGKALLLGNPNPIRADLPMGGGEGWIILLLEFIYTIVIGTGTGAVSEGELGIIKNITFKTDVDGESHTAPGRALYRHAHFMLSQPPVKDAIAAASAVYRCVVPLLFADDNSIDQDESILDTGRYNSAELNISLGTIADLITTPGTATVAVTLNCSVVRTRGKLGPNDKPDVYPYIKGLPGVDYTKLEMELERSADLRLRRLFWLNTTGSAAGVPFSGTPVDDSINKISIEHQQGYEFKKVLRQQLADENKGFYKIETRPVGWYALDFMKSGVFSDSFLTDPRFVSKLKQTWEIESGTAAVINPLVDGARALKPIVGR